MSCSKHFLGFQWTRHAWQRRVTLSEPRMSRTTDQWGRVVPVEHVVCHAQYVCRTCGAVRDDGICGCDPAHAEHCAVRVAWLAEAREQPQGAHA
jgi:hypothetical protein